MSKQTFSMGFKQDMESHNVISKMSKVKFKIMQHMKNQENLDIVQEKRQSIKQPQI